MIWRFQKLIENAYKSGFDAVKFQKRNIDKVYKKEFLDWKEKVHGEKRKEIKKMGLN